MRSKNGEEPGAAGLVRVHERYPWNPPEVSNEKVMYRFRIKLHSVVAKNWEDRMVRSLVAVASTKTGSLMLRHRSMYGCPRERLWR